MLDGRISIEFECGYQGLFQYKAYRVNALPVLITLKEGKARTWNYKPLPVPYRDAFAAYWQDQKRAYEIGAAQRILDNPANAQYYPVLPDTYGIFNYEDEEES